MEIPIYQSRDGAHNILTSTAVEHSTTNCNTPHNGVCVHAHLSVVPFDTYEETFKKFVFVICGFIFLHSEEMHLYS